MDAGTAAITTPASGWSVVSGAPWGSATPKLTCFYRFLQAGDGNPVITISGSSGTLESVAAAATFNGVDTSTPIEAVGTASAGTGTPITAGTINTLTDGAWALGLCGRGDNETFSTETFGGSATGVVEQLDAGEAAGGDDGQVCIYSKPIASYGATGNGSAASSSTDPWVSVLIALKPAVAPTVTTQAVDTIAEETATGHGNVTADGGAAVTERGVCWKTSTGPTTADSKATDGTGTGAFSPLMTGLAPATHYYVKAYAINSVGTSYGSEVTFDTINWAVRLKLSTNIPAGGTTATTRQLTIPSGKAAGDYEAGKITDDTNPLASFNPGSAKFSEWEVCIEGISALLSTGDQLRISMSNAGVALDSYTHEAIWEIGAGAAGPVIPVFMRSYRAWRT
jgi:hypothetical protein